MRIVLILAFLLALTGCTTGVPSTPVINGGAPVVTFTPLVLPSAVRTLVPASTPVPPTRTPEITEAYPAPPDLASVPGFSSAPYSDCARTPGLPACGGGEGLPAGRIAWTEVQAGRTISVDLETGSGWQVPQQAAWLDWSPDGEKLLLAGGEGDYFVLARDGQLLNAFKTAQVPVWQPDNQLSLDSSVHSAEGQTARLEMTADSRWNLHVAPSVGGEETVFSIALQPTDELYLLRGWVPGTALVLAQRYFASNAALTRGGTLITIDTLTSEVRALDALADLSPRAALHWNPAQPSLLAFLETSQEGVMAPRLALLDFANGSLRYPLPDGLLVSDPAWQPDGQRLAFSVLSAAMLAPPEAERDFPGPGIYLLDPQTGAVERITQAPAGAVDGWPHWSADGQTLIYARVITAAGGLSSMEVRLHSLSDGSERLLVSGLTPPEPEFERPNWSTILAFTN